MLTVEPIDIVSALRCMWMSLVLQNGIPTNISQSNFSITKAVIGRFNLPKLNVKWNSPSMGRLDLSAKRAEWRVDFTAIPERLTWLIYNWRCCASVNNYVTRVMLVKCEENCEGITFDFLYNWWWTFWQIRLFMNEQSWKMNESLLQTGQNWIVYGLSAKSMRDLWIVLWSHYPEEMVQIGQLDPTFSPKWSFSEK